MRILSLNYEFPPLGGGASPLTYGLVKGYAKLGHEVDVITMGFRGLPKYEEIEGVTVYRVSCLRAKKEICTNVEMLSYLLPGFLKAYSLNKKKKYDINHTHFIVPTGIISIALKFITGLPYIITSHGSDVPGHNPTRFRVIYKLITPLVRLICLKAYAIISPSKSLRDEIKSKISKDLNLFLIPSGINLKEFKPAKNKKKIILSAGRIYDFKGFQHIIQAVKNIEIGWELHVAGDGPYLSELKNLAKNSKTKILFHGWVTKEKLIELYSEASIFIQASKKENLSVVLLEALASGCAVLTTNDSGMEEVSDGVGETFKFGNVRDLQKKIKLVISNLKKYQRASIKKAQDFDINKLILKNEEVLKMY